MGALYRLDFPNGKSYIGITSGTVGARFIEHVEQTRRQRKWAVHKAILKYGADSVRVVTLVIADSWDYLCLLERKAIEVFGTFGKAGYNLTEGGDGFRGRHTEETKAKIAEKSRNCTDETREKLRMAARLRERGANYGCKHSESANAKKSIRNLMSNKPLSNNTSGHTGVYWNAHAGKWQAYFKVNGKQNYIGLFENINDAVAKRAAAVEKYLSGIPA